MRKLELLLMAAIIIGGVMGVSAIANQSLRYVDIECQEGC